MPDKKPASRNAAVDAQWRTFYGGSLEPTIAYVRWLRAQNGALREIAAAVAAVDPVVYNGEPHCLYGCAGHVEASDEGTHYFAHSSACAYVKALELTSTEDVSEARTDAD